MVTVVLPDQSRLTHDDGATALDVIRDISPRLAEAAVAAQVNGQTVDLNSELPVGEWPFRALTAKDAEAVEVLRHSCAHVMARAVTRLFPDVKLAFGPPIEDGFYYDMDLPHSLCAADFEAIEAEMARIIELAEPFERFERPLGDARQLCDQMNQSYKVEHIDDDLKQYDSVSFYRQGEFVDLCRGPHLPDPSRIGAFKVMSVAGAHWMKDPSRPMLQRLYGTAFFKKKDLEAYLKRVEEAKKRDHRVLGKQLGLFTISPQVGSGLILWMPKGAIIRDQLERFIKDQLLAHGYEAVYTPHVAKVDLYKQSGHYPYYSDSQFSPMDIDGDLYLLKPMNCPHHILIYQARPRSYRDLPVRLAEFGTVYRYEQTGELAGMTRVRGFTQDDAHLFCTAEQVKQEFRDTMELTRFFLDVVGFEYRVQVGLRDADGDSDKYSVEDPVLWDRAEREICEVLTEMEMSFTEVVGEAAFYGPKADFMVRDCIGREWQLGTVQLDYVLPQRFALEYTGSDNQPHRPVMIHRAPLGSMERFCGILIEHFAGAFPLWLAPEQVRVLPISDHFVEYGHRVLQSLQQAGLRATLDQRPEKIGHRIREAQLEKIPYMLIVGKKEEADGTVSLRDRVQGDLGAQPLDAVVARFQQEVADMALPSAQSS